MDNYNYPVGADNKDAPWNKEEAPIKEFDVFISQTLSKTTTISTNNYIYNVEKGEDGEVEEDIDTSNTDWELAYKESHYTPLDLIKICKELADEVIKLRQINIGPQYRKYLHIKIECNRWVEDDLVIMED